MCGIAGYSRVTDRKSSVKDGREFARALAIGIEDRGRDATGFGWVDPTTGHPYYWKNQGAASKVAWDVDLPSGIKTLIAHTRWATQGDPKFNENNHPVIAPGIVLVHNGVVDNDDDIIEAVDHDRLGRVDSEAIAALLSLGPASLGAAHPGELLEQVEGSAAIAWLDTDTPDSLHLARLSARPLALAWTKRGDLVFGSTPKNLEWVQKSMDTTFVRVETIPEGTYLRVVSGEVVERSTFKPTPSRYRRYTYGSGWKPMTPTTTPTTTKPTKPSGSASGATSTATPTPTQKTGSGKGQKKGGRSSKSAAQLALVPAYEQHGPAFKDRYEWSTAAQSWVLKGV